MQDDYLSVKPKLRGTLHGLAFICTLISAVLFLIASFLRQFNLGILIYILSQLLQYGVSSFYHIPNWSPRVRRMLQHLDHMCIFILISGTQTSVIVNSIGLQETPIARLVIKLSWTISLIGILKIALMNRLHNIFDLILYCVHGAIIAPFYKVISGMHAFDKFLVYTGGLLYLTGGLVYGLEKPNPYPKTFGWHEIFHVFTIAANMCFGIIITRRYIASIFFSN